MGSLESVRVRFESWAASLWTSPGSARAARRIHSQHGSLREALRAMRREIEALAHPREGHAASARTARRRLEKLDRMLAAHFALEERSGRIESAVHAAPQFHPRAIALRDQHRAFLAEMERIRTKARQASGPDAWMGIERTFLVLSESIRDHEMAEGEILSSAILDDLGGG